MSRNKTESVVVRGSSGLAQTIEAGGHTLLSDEPESAGGTNTGPDPYELLLAALGSCTSMTLRMYANHKGWPLTAVTVELSQEKIHARDCADCESERGRIDEIQRVITLEGDLDAEQRARLIEIANKCPVHKTLLGEIKIRTREAG